ncbi:MAG: glycosyltransferase family 4 protein [Syntrophomonadaceae bacterium]|nr:glycosyltransferase family 4 protein [Syntrophomonadaceae bacterium]
MKILILSWEYPPHMVGGLGQHVYDLSYFLARRGVSVHIITPRVIDVPDYELDRGVHIRRVGRPSSEDEDFRAWTFSFNSEAIREAVRLSAETGGFNVIHAHDWLVAYAGRALAKAYEIPLVSTIHATEHGRNLGLHNRVQREINEIEKNLALHAERVICCSEYMAQQISCLFGMPQQEIRVIPNGVVPEQYTELPDSVRIQIDRNETVIFFIGRLVPEKGVYQLIQAMPEVIAAVPNARLYIGGRGPQQEILETLIAKLGIKDRVVFTGFLKPHHRNYLYQQASVAVFPSLYEPFGIVALEAMATKTPVIVGDTGGLAEIVRHKENGLKVKPGDEKVLAEEIIRVLKDKELSRRMAENAARELMETYDWNLIAARTIEVYEEAIARFQSRGLPPGRF